MVSLINLKFGKIFFIKIILVLNVLSVISLQKAYAQNKTEMTDSLLKVEPMQQYPKRIHTQLLLSELYLNTDSVTARKYATLALEKAKNLRENALVVSSYSILAKISNLHFDYNNSYEYLSAALKYTDSVNSPNLYYRLKYEIAEVFMEKTMFHDSYQFAYSSLNYYEKFNNSDTIGYLYNILGKLHWYLGELDKANEMHMMALTFFEAQQNKLGQAITCNHLGNIFYSLENYNRSLSYYNQALSLLNKNNDLKLYTGIINNKAEVYEALRDNVTALRMHKESYLISRKIKHRAGIAISADNIGEIYMNTGKLDSADDYFNIALKEAQLINYKYAQTYTFNNLGKLNTLRGRYHEAEVFLKKAEQISESSKLKELQLLNYYYFMDLYKKSGRFEESLNYYNQYVKIKELLGNEKMTNKIAELQIKYDADKKQTQINILNESNKLIRELNKRQLWLLMFSGIALVMLTILALLLIKKDRRNKHANVLLANRNAEINATQIELQRVNSELKESANRLKMIVHKLPVIMNAIDEEGNFIFWNEECEKVSGYTAQEMVHNKNALSLLYPNESDRILLTTGILHKKDFRNEITKITCKDQTQRVISWSNVSKSAPIPGWWEWIVGIDITERYNFEHSLQQEKAILNSLINSIPFVVYYKDLNGKYMGYNPAFISLYSHLEGSLIGLTDYDIFSTQEAEEAEIIEAELMKSRHIWTGEYWYDVPDKKKILFQTSKSPIINDKGDVIGLVCISRDITERFEYEQELDKARLKAEQSDKLKSAFLANMSHEIRTPMNAIIGFAELLNNHELTHEQQELYIQYINNSGNNLLNLIDDIIDTAKIEAGQIKIRKTKTQINKVLDELLLSFSDIMKRKNVNLVELRLLKSLDDRWMVINTDSNRFRQIVSNLLGNAIKFTDAGYIEFGYKYLEHSDELEFFVKDTGIGIAEDKFQVIFERFGQIDKDIARNTKGTGLGLNITQKLVELLGGRIWVDSVLGKGAIFYFTLPYTPIKELNEEKSELKPKVNTEMRSSWPGKLILIVEDDRLNYTILKKYLQKSKVNIIWAQNGQEAIDLCKKQDEENQNIDLILMDMQMPIMNGFEATRLIVKLFPYIPVIAQTANAMNSEKDDAAEAGCLDYITKPIRQSQLLDVLNKYLN